MTVQDSDAPTGSHKTYHFPRLLLIKIAVGLLPGFKRSAAVDSLRILRGNPPLPRVVGLESIPVEGPFVIVANHYERPGLPTYFAGMAVCTAVAERRPASPETSWIITSEWLSRHFGPIPVPVWLSRWAFGRVAVDVGVVAEDEEGGQRGAEADHSDQGQPQAREDGLLHRLGFLVHDALLFRLEAQDDVGGSVADQVDP